MLLLLLMLPQLVLAQRQAAEPDLKAAILANMLLFIDWPESSGQPQARLSLCYLSESPVAAALARFDGKSVKNRQLRVARIDAAQLAQCHAVYMGPDDSPLLNEPKPDLRSGGVLLAGDSPGYLQRGVMLNLELVAGQVVFDVDLRATRQAGLSVSSKALRLARTVME